VLLAIRADYYGRCAAYPQLSGLLAANQVLVGAMHLDEARQVVTCPARRVGLQVEPELVEALVEDVEGEPGALPLLSAALLELWQLRDGGRLRHAAYERSGGVRGAVARLAEQAFGRLDPADKSAARGILMRLVAEGEDGAVERRRVPLAELETGTGIAPVVEVLTEYRLLTISAGAIELAHEALLREWPRLRRWIDEDREGLRIQRSLTAGATEWHRLERDEGALYGGGRLTEALEWRAHRDVNLSRLEREFLDASEAHRRRERTARRRRRTLAFAALTTVLVAAVTVSLAAVFTEREHDISASRDLATKSESLVAADPRLALAVALEALRRHDTEQAENAIRQATYAHRETRLATADRGSVFNVSSARDGQHVATTGEDGIVRIWSVASGRLSTTLDGDGTPVLAASFSPDGDRVASVSVDGAIAVTRMSDHRRMVLRPLAADDYARSVEFSPDGDSLLIGTAAGIVGLVRLGGGPSRLERLGSHEDRVKASFDAHGERIVSAGEDDTARVWRIGAGAPLVLKHPDAVLNAVFSPDGDEVITAGADGELRIWNAQDGRLVRRLPVPGGKLLAVHYSPDGKQLVVACEDAVVRILDVRGGPVLAELKGHAGVAYDAVFVRSGALVMSVGQDGTLRTWQPPRVTQVPLTGRPANATSVSVDGRHVAEGYLDGEVRIWDLTTGADIELPRHDTAATVSYSPNGRYVISASIDGAVRVWDVGRQRSRLVPTKPGERYAVAVDPSGRRVAIATLDDDTWLMDADGRHASALHGHTSEVTALAFSPDGKHLLSASEDKTARLWSAADGREERVLRGGNAAVIDAAYSGDGTRVATADTDGTVRVWPVAGGDRAVVLYGHEGQVNSVDFDRDGARVVTTGKDGTVRVWNASGGEALVVVDQHVGSASVAAFSPDGQRVLSAGDEGVLRISPCEVCGPFPHVLRLASTRLAAKLTAADRQRLVSGSG
jgi:WD40 repeat protein